MDTHLRFEKNQVTKEFATVLDFSSTMGIVRTAELCNGSGDCRKTEIGGGTMCPSYMATRKEKETTRARANILREMLTRSTKPNPFAHDEIAEVMDLCLGCKGCKSECPSNVDLAKLKQEWQYQYYKEKGVPLRARMIGSFASGMRVAAMAPRAYSFVFNNRVTGPLVKSMMGFSPKRTMPEISSATWSKWFKREFQPTAPLNGRVVHLFLDELLNYNEPHIGITAVKLLDTLGYTVKWVGHEESGRSYLSKGLLDQAKSLAEKNVARFGSIVGPDAPLVGVEPSAILTFRDEYPDLLRGEEKAAARRIAASTFMIEEFLAKELDASRIDKGLFKEEGKVIKLHGHCQQKALSSLTPVKKVLTQLGGNEVHIIPSGCCGMAGSFGFQDGATVVACPDCGIGRNAKVR